MSSKTFRTYFTKNRKENILHVGVNNTEKDEEDEILRKYEKLGNNVDRSLTI